MVYPFRTLVVLHRMLTVIMCLIGLIFELFFLYLSTSLALHWRHNDHDGVSNHQLHGCLLNRLFRRRSKKTSKLRVTGLCVGNSPGPVNSPHKGPVTRKMLPFDDVTIDVSAQGHFFFEEFQALQLLLLAAFGSVDETLASCMMAHFGVCFLNDNLCVIIV